MPSDTLESLRDRIAALHVTRCRMSHERVRVENGAALWVSRGGEERSLVRVGLCSPEVRARNLACGHTMARYVLLDAVGALHAAGRLPGRAHDELREALENVSNSIHLLDHQKGDAERDAALSSDADRASAEVKRLEEQHDAYAERMRELRAAVLAHLDAAIHERTVRGDVSCPLP
jgi:chaperonin cofactor prefoldin